MNTLTITTFIIKVWGQPEPETEVLVNGYVNGEVINKSFTNKPDAINFATGFANTEITINN